VGCCHGEDVAHRYRRPSPDNGRRAHSAATDAGEARNPAFYPGLDDWGYGRSIEWRFTRGGFDSPGAADVWARVRLPLVAGVALTGQDRALILADSANGLSLSLLLTKWFSIPPTITATLLPEDDFVSHFAADVDPVKAKVMYAVQQPLAMSAFGEVMGVPAWKTLPSWYLVAAGDRALPPGAERMFASRMGATTVEIPASHVAMVSHPGEVAQLIKTAAEAAAAAT
jgi:hypothetical protein